MVGYLVGSVELDRLFRCFVGYYSVVRTETDVVVRGIYWIGEGQGRTACCDAVRTPMIDFK